MTFPIMENHLLSIACSLDADTGLESAEQRARLDGASKKNLSTHFSATADLRAGTNLLAMQGFAAMPEMAPRGMFEAARSAPNRFRENGPLRRPEPLAIV
ncbi:hypothetical protein ACFQI3_15545 [Hansschlegelia quercus]|uniref:Uncharacterized protein n=1 Tax=Hansschlegelia quercus TaxID=2528245 RepID=A0A4Q9GAW6_9HYPH|nr:hypothetical protein [Hansschlegelia quercus]TBN48248.1 hypothetical protein EYR15_14320 [Hansschlegelia quercus]